MKVFDATAVIAFLAEMDFPQGFGLLSKDYELVIPSGVVKEITKSATKTKLDDLISEKIVKVVDVDNAAVEKIMDEHPQLHRGECEAIVFAKCYCGPKSPCIVSDDKKARAKFGDMKYKWTQRLLDIMREKGRMDDKAHAALMERLSNSPFYVRGRKG